MEAKYEMEKSRLKQDPQGGSYYVFYVTKMDVQSLIVSKTRKKIFIIPYL